jgi:hypothetical protein
MINGVCGFMPLVDEGVLKAKGGRSKRSQVI